MEPQVITQTQTPALVKGIFSDSWIKHIHIPTSSRLFVCPEQKSCRYDHFPEALVHFAHQMSPSSQQTLGPDPNLHVVTWPACDSDILWHPDNRTEGERRLGCDRQRDRWRFRHICSHTERPDSVNDVMQHKTTGAAEEQCST